MIMLTDICSASREGFHKLKLYYFGLYKCVLDQRYVFTVWSYTDLYVALTLQDVTEANHAPVAA